MNEFAAIPLFGNRVAPRCGSAQYFMEIQLTDRNVVSRKKIDLAHTQERWVDYLIERGIDLLICGGIERELQSHLEANGIRIIGNVAGEIEDVITALSENRLHSWFGYKRIGIPEAGPDQERDHPDGDRITEKKDFNPPSFSVNCLECKTRSCQKQGGCTAFTQSSISEMSREVPASSEHAFFLTSLTGGPIARMEDLGAYCHSLKCNQVGMVFCSAVFSEMEWILGQLDASIQTLPICCCFGKQHSKSESSFGDTFCDPHYIASILNHSDTDLIVTVGPCSEYNAILDRSCRAPVISSIGRDRRAGGMLFPITESCTERAVWREKHCMKNQSTEKNSTIERR